MPGVVVYRLDDRLLFANSRYVKGRIREAVAGAPSTTRHLVFDAEGFVGIDASGVEAMEQILDSLDQSGISLVVARLKAHLEERFETSGLVARIGRDRFFGSVTAAVTWCRGHDDGEDGSR
jgi:SulP family sulfate permease